MTLWVDRVVALIAVLAALLISFYLGTQWGSRQAALSVVDYEEALDVCMSGFADSLAHSKLMKSGLGQLKDAIGDDCISGKTLGAPTAGASEAAGEWHLP